MDAFVGLILVIAAIAAIIFFKRLLVKVSKHAEDIVTTNIAESSIELIRRSHNAYADLIDEFGEDFETPQQIYDKIYRKRKKVK